MKQYEWYLEKPLRGTQSISVIASTRKEAIEKANNFDYDSADFAITWYGKARTIERGKPSST